MAEPVGIRERVAEVLENRLYRYYVSEAVLDSIAGDLLEAFPQLAEEQWEYTWVGEDWVLGHVFATKLEAAEFGGSANGLWVQRRGGRIMHRRSRRAGEWEEVS